MKMNGPVSSFLRSAGSDETVEERRDVVGEVLRVLVEEAVVRVGVDSELGVWEVLGQQAAVLRVQSDSMPGPSTRRQAPVVEVADTATV